jgi:formamidopyrimidine-DNA glycosylase
LNTKNHLLKSQHTLSQHIHPRTPISFSDPRKFGTIVLEDSEQRMHALVPDALEEEHEGVQLDRLAGLLMTGVERSYCIQKESLVGGIGSPTDEVLYQTQTHPNQTQTVPLLQTLREIFRTAVDCTSDSKDNISETTPTVIREENTQRQEGRLH